MTQAKSIAYLANQRRRSQSGDGLPMTEQERWMSLRSARLRRGSAPELSHFLLPPIDDRKTNRSFSPRRGCRSPANNSILEEHVEETDNSVEGKLFFKKSLSSTSLSNKGNLSRHSSNQSLNSSLVGKTGSLTLRRNFSSNSLTGLSTVPPEHLKPRTNANPEQKPLEKNQRFRRRLSDTPLPRKNMLDKNLRDKDSSINNDKCTGLNKSNSKKTKATNNYNKGIKNENLIVRPPSIAKSDSNLTCETLQGIDNNSSGSDDENHVNDNRIIEWLVGVEPSLLTHPDGTPIEKNEDELENITETAIRIVYEEKTES